METTRIADLANDDRPREKAQRIGVDKLSLTELIAIALGSGIPGKSVIELSREVLASVGNRPAELSRLSIKEMCRKFKGVGPAKAVQLAAAIELGRRCTEPADFTSRPMTDPQLVYEYVRYDLQHLDHEEFRILILSRSARVKGMEVISSGGTSGTVVDIKLLLKKAIDALADAIILIHNHPSGTLAPSREDDALTRRICEAARAIDIRVLDHLIISPTGFYSYSSQGRLP